MRLLAPVLFAALLSSPAFAGDAVFTILRVAVSNETKTIIITTVEPQSTSVCTLPDEFRMSTTAADSVYKEVYATALAALLSGRQLRIGYSDSQCLSNGPVIRAVFLAP